MFMSSTAGAVERALAAVDSMTVRRQLIATNAWALLVLMPVLALVLLVRRLSGAFDQPLGGLAIVVAALVLETAAWLIRRLARSTQYSVLSTTSPIGFGVVSAITVLILASLTLPGTPVVGIIIAWLVLIAGEVAQGVNCFQPGLWRRWNARLAVVSVSTSSSAADEAEFPAGLVQQMTRVREGDRESLHALMRAEIPSGDRLAVLHLSFCPPLAEAPELTAHAVDAENAEVRVMQAETFGARIEVRLPREEATPRSVMVEVLGTVADTRRSGM
jgi:hypothetical protein